MLDARQLVVGCASFLVAAGASAAGAPVVHDQSNVSAGPGAGGMNINACYTANELVLAAPARIEAVQVWLQDGPENDNGLLDNFSGELSMAIFANGTEVDEVNEPADEVHRAVGRNVEYADTGLQAGTRDLFVATFDLDPPVTLGAGTWWLSVREGNDFDVADGTEIWWEQATSIAGLPSFQICGTPEPGSWNSGSEEASMVVYAVPTAWDQSAIAPAGGDMHFLNNFVQANDFDLATPATFSAVDLWLTDDAVNDDGVLTTFSGTIGWAVYADNAGLPGSTIVSGYQGDAGFSVASDAGVQAVGDRDVVRTRFELGRSVSLAAGRFWFAVHEGGWLSPNDLSFVGWYQAASRIHVRTAGDTDEEAPGDSWVLSSEDEDGAFVLFDDLLFASGFESGKGCAWSSFGGLCP
jgi:hypothetical protein